MEVDNFFRFQVKPSVDRQTTVVRVLSREKLFCGRRKSWNAFQLNRNKWTLVNIQQFCPNFESNLAEFTITSPIWKHWQQILKLLHLLFSKLRISCFALESSLFQTKFDIILLKTLDQWEQEFRICSDLIGPETLWPNIALLYKDIIYQTKCIGELFSNKLSEAWERFSF